MTNSFAQYLLKSLPLEKLHHTYIIVGPSGAAREATVEFLREAFSLSHAYPDLWMKEYESVGVDDVAEIADVHLRKPLGNNKKFIIFETAQITQPAQNSLLKMLEEPAPGTHFFIIMPSAVMLLPTVLSRAHVVTLDVAEQDGHSTLEAQEGKNDAQGGMTVRAHAFVRQSKTNPRSERLAIVTELLADYDKERISRQDIYIFVQEVERLLHEQYSLSQTKNQTQAKAPALAEGQSSASHQLKTTQFKEAMTVVTHVETYMRDTSASLKLLLEYLALRLPTL